MATPAPKIRFREPQIEMAHGAGGKASRRLVEGLFAPLLFGSSQGPLGDAAHIQINGTRIAMTTDSFVVKPLRFPGGSIGELAINGTVNDLAVSGARAEAIVVTFVLEAGLPTDVLEAEVRAMAQAAEKAGVMIAGGDTKVVEHGKADSMYITTTGIGRLLSGVEISPQSVRPATRFCSPVRSEITASRFCWPGAISIWKPICVRTRDPCFRSFRGSCAKPAQASAGCAIPRAAASPLLSTNWHATAASESFSSKKKFPFAIPCAAPANFSASIRCTSRMKGNFSPSFLPSRRNPRCRLCARPLAEKKQR